MQSCESKSWKLTFLNVFHEIVAPYWTKTVRVEGLNVKESDMGVSEGAVCHTVTSDTQTGLDCWWRILSFRLSYQTLELGCRSIRAGEESPEKNDEYTL